MAQTSAEKNTAKRFRGLHVDSEVFSIKAMHGKIPGDFLKPSLISRIKPEKLRVDSLEGDGEH